MDLSPNARFILEKRYLAIKEDGTRETPEDMFRRVAKHIANAEKENKKEWEEKFYNMMVNLEALPNSPTLMNSGKQHGVLSGCFVLKIEDHLADIFETVKKTAIIFKMGGGVGINFSPLRPQGALVTTTRGLSSGTVSFMKVFDVASEQVKQGGVRKGAFMGILDITHPEIESFIRCKTEEGQLSNFNISVAITDKFMEAVDKDETITLSHPASDEKRVVKAKTLWKLIIEQAWKNGEPGIIFIDRINEFNKLPALGNITSTNPCVVGSTLVQTVEGLVPIKELVGKEMDVYCMDAMGCLTIAKATNIKLTQLSAKLVRVVTTRGDLICTPDHKVYTKNRGFVEASELTPVDKIVGLNRKMHGERYSAVGLTGGHYTREHRFIVGHYEDIVGKDVHHKDGNTLHNVKSNLEVLEHSEHSVLSNNGHENWNEKDSKGRWLSKETLAKRVQLELNENPVGVNLRVLGVEELDYTEDVYDMTVEGYHNFIANGLVVHNCGEQPLFPNESCNLGSINLTKFVDVDKKDFDWSRLEEVVKTMTRFLDNVIDVNIYPLPEIQQMTQANRKIGLGVMGWADSLLLLKLRYDSKIALRLAERVMKFVHETAVETSKELAREKGSFSNFDKSVYWKESKQGRMWSLRNACMTSIAPTGTLSALAGVSSGIEPNFAWEYFSNRLDTTLKENHYIAKKYLDKNEDLPEYFVTAAHIKYEDHIKMQAAFQKWTDASISKTINMSNESTLEDVEKAYKLAFESNCKGITVYREGSRKYEMLSKDGKGQSAEVKLKPVPKEADAKNYYLTTGCGKLYIDVTLDSNKKPLQLFTNVSHGGCPSNTEAIGRIASMWLRAGLPIEQLADKLRNIKCPSAMQRSKECKSCPDGIALVLDKYIDKKKDGGSNICPSCKAKLVVAEGCISCPSCGFTKCSG